MCYSYRELKAALSELTDEQLGMSVTIVDSNGECFPIQDLYVQCNLPVPLNEEYPFEDTQPLMLIPAVQDLLERSITKE